MYFEKLLENLRQDSSYDNIMKNVINTFSLYFLCDHFIGDEAWKWGILPKLSGKNDLNTTNNIDAIQDYDILQCQFTFFEHFVNNILPNINKKIILTTSCFQNSFFTSRNEMTDMVLNHPNILLWISVNPIYPSSDKFMAFPLGLAPFNLSVYADTLLHKPIIKENEVVHMHLSETNECRRVLPQVDICSEIDFYDNIRKSKFMISPIGDRDDCYRNYECIGLQTIPISNVNDFHRPIFMDNMYYCNIDTMVETINTNNVNYEYKPPNQDLICVEYYKDLIYKRIEELRG